MIEGLRAPATACGDPVAVPLVDVDQVTNELPGLTLKMRFDPSNLKGECARLWATPYFLLGMKLTSHLPGNNITLMDLHLIPTSGLPNGGGKNELVQQFDKSISNALDA